MRNLFLSYILILFLPYILFSKDDSQGVVRRQQSFNQEKLLNVEITYSNGYISIDRLLTKNIFEGEFIYKDHRPSISYDVISNEGKLEIFFSGIVKKGDRRGDSQNFSSLKKMYDNELRLDLSDKIPVELELELGVVKGDLNLSGLKIKNINLQVGVSQSAIIFDKPNPVTLEQCSIEGGVGTLLIEKLGFANIKNFSFEGGLGSYEIDFGGKYQQNLKANIEMGMGKLTLFLPKYIGTRLKLEKSFLSAVSIDDCYKKSDYYYNDQWEKSSHQLDIMVETGVGKLDVVWIDE
jgi:hypothetical protein